MDELGQKKPIISYDYLSITKSKNKVVRENKKHSWFLIWDFLGPPGNEAF